MIYIRRRVIGRGRRTSYMLRNVHIRYRSSAIAASNSRIVTLAISHKCNSINTKKVAKVKLTVNYCRAVFLYRLASLEIFDHWKYIESKYILFCRNTETIISTELYLIII